MAINKELLARVRDHILEEPRRYDQLTTGEYEESVPCGTRACIAGWTYFFGTGRDPRFNSCMYDAQELLGLSNDEAMVLFDANGDWPEPYSSAYKTAEKEHSHAGMAQAAADYINHIIETGKVLS
jgi:hypothetical protein